MKASQINTGEPAILEGQSIVLGEVKAEALAREEEPREPQIVLQQYFQQGESLSPENRVSKFCKEAGFMRVVEVGQYFVTRNAGEFLLHTVACREYTLPRDDPASEAKGDGFKEIRELDLFWKSRRAISTSNSESKFESNQ